jgi:Fe-S cluster biosynthesis and repair protein YggX
MKKSLLIFNQRDSKCITMRLANYFFKDSCTEVEGTISSLKV